jgi:hypothetical protein
MRSSIVPALLGVLVGCGGGGSAPGDAPSTNPAKLWLANDLVETRVKLVDTEPRPF